ncbi:hypothetical protein CNR22_00910 [Sphingobacteriaceae bacterium]|nr:hypothetical protein CNR22_00910 [Sphingobacteriaceae bacterium]
MKVVVFISFFVFSHLAYSQDDFFSIHNKIDAILKRQKVADSHEVQVIKRKDTSAFKELQVRSALFFKDSLSPLTGKLANMNFPDINFVDAENKVYALSDFSGKEMVVNYNYLYCQPCLGRVDSTLFLLKHREVKFLLLFSDVYQKETSDLKNYDDKVLIGFINEDTKELISLGLGDNVMYYLDPNRQIDFFDKTSTLTENEIAWIHYLKTQKK